MLDQTCERCGVTLSCGGDDCGPMGESGSDNWNMGLIRLGAWRREFPLCDGCAGDMREVFVDFMKTSTACLHVRRPPRPMTPTGPAGE